MNYLISYKYRVAIFQYRKAKKSKIQIRLAIYYILPC